MFCNYCAVPNPDDARFCSSCGKSLGGAVSADTTSSAITAGDAIRSDSPMGSRHHQTIGNNPTIAAPGQTTTSGLLTPGDTFAKRYEITRLVGRGGMGVVYEARDTVINEPVAIKILLESLAASQDAVTRFTREAKISRQLSHKHIVRVHDIGTCDGTLFISMEYVNGVNLRGFLDLRRKQKKPMSIHDIMLLARPICEAMEYAHEITVHRDLKPENILVARDGRVRVSDFGIAALLTLSESRLTSGALGTAYYMAPEQIDGQAKVDRRADIYSLGVILYEAIVGKVPVGRFKPPAECREDVPQHMDEAIIKALDPDPAQRPRTILEFLDELRGVSQAVLSGETDSENDDSEPTYPLNRESTPAVVPKRASKSNPQAAQQALVDAKKELESGSPIKALELFDRAIQCDPTLAEAWFLRAQALNKAKLGKDRDDTLRRIAQGKMTADEAKHVAADIVASMKKAAELEPGNAVYTLTATLAEKQAQSSGVVLGTEAKGSAVQKGGGFFGWFGGNKGGEQIQNIVGDGNTHLNAGRYDAALKKFEQAIKDDRRCAAAWYGKGMALMKKLGSDSADALARITRGELSVDEAQRIGNEAKTCLQKAAKLEPSNAVYQLVASQIKG